MLPTYCLREDTIFDKDRKEHIVYGIQAIDKDGTILLSFHDVFFDRQKAKHLVKLCNKGKLPLFHLADVVEDAVIE